MIPATPPEVVEALIAHPGTRRINFTGSTRVGRIIAETCGRHLKRSLLELGGKAPMIVMADADLDEAVNAANFGAFMHSGQICMATERIIVDGKVADEFTDGLAKKASAMTVGDPTNPETMIGPLINKARSSVSPSWSRTRSRRAPRSPPAARPRAPASSPPCSTKVTPEMRVYSEESFGPVVPILTSTDIEDAIRTPTTRITASSGAVFSPTSRPRSMSRGGSRAGICHVNVSTVHDEPQMPFGGVKESGWGRFGGSAALEEFTDLHWTMVMSEPGHYPI